MEELTDIPIKDHELPASELDLGKKEEIVFRSAQKVIPEGMIEETYTSLLGFCTYLRPRPKIHFANI